MRRGATANPSSRLPAGICAAAVVVMLVAWSATTGAPSATAANACGKFGDRNPDRISERQAHRAIRCLLNRERSQRGLSNLRSNERLESAATRHTKHMRATGCFDHNCAGEPAVESRLWGAGYLRSGLVSWSWGENIAWGQGGGGTPRSMVKAWMHSPSHRASILNRTFRDVGVGFRPGTPSNPNADGGIYTTDFGHRR